MDQDTAKIEVQGSAQHVEGDSGLNRQSDVLLKSGLDDLGLWATVKRFKKVSCYSEVL